MGNKPKLLINSNNSNLLICLMYSDNDNASMAYILHYWHFHDTISVTPSVLHSPRSSQNFRILKLQFTQHMVEYCKN